jgi:hypothetical protein
MDDSLSRIDVKCEYHKDSAFIPDPMVTIAADTQVGELGTETDSARLSSSENVLIFHDKAEELVRNGDEHVPGTPPSQTLSIYSVIHIALKPQ